MNTPFVTFSRSLFVYSTSVFVLAACSILFYVSDVPRTYSLSEIEGTNLMQARLLNSGFETGSVLPSNAPRLLPLYLAVTFRFLGDDAQTARWFMAFHSFLLLLLTGSAAWILFGGIAGIVAVVLSSASMVFAYSVCDVQSALIAVTWGMAGFVAIICPTALPPSFRLGAGGIAAGLALLTDSVSGAFLILHTLAIARFHSPPVNSAGQNGLPRFAKSIAIYLLFCVMTYSASCILLQPHQLSHFTLAEHVSAMMVRAFGLPPLLRVLKVFGYEHCGLVFVAAVGAIYLIARQWREGLILIYWVIATLFTIVGSGFDGRPDLIALLIPVAMLASSNILWIEKAIRSSIFGVFSICLLPIALFAALPNGFFWFVPTKLLEVRLRGRSNSEVRAAISFIKENSLQNEFVLSDQPMLVFRADRRMPPMFVSVMAENPSKLPNQSRPFELRADQVGMVVISKRADEVWLDLSKQFERDFTMKELAGYSIWLRQERH